MSCLAHDKRFRASFHQIINELRKENRTPVPVLRTMPNQCCTCNDENKESIESVMMKDENQSPKFKELIERVHREKQTNPKLILSLNRFENLIEQNRTSAPVASVPTRAASISRRSSSDWEDATPMEVSKPSVRYNKKKTTVKPPKPIRTGTFVFLPYKSEGRKTRNSSDTLLDVANTLQRSRFINRLGHLSLIEKQYDVLINMITRKTNQQVTDALENAKNGLDKLTIHNKKQTMKIAEKQQGEWVLLRSKKSKKQTEAENIEKAVEDLTSRWDSCLTISKRGRDEEDDGRHSHRKTRRTSSHRRGVFSSVRSKK